MADTLIHPAGDFKVITPSDSVNIPQTRGLYVGVAGNVVCINASGTAITFTALPVGIHPIRTTRVNSTSTTATDLVALY